MGAGRAESHVVGSRVAGDVLADQAQVGRRLGDVGADAGAGLEHALHQLGLQLVGHLGLGGLRQQLLDAGHEVEPGRVEEHVLLLHADGQRRPRAEPVVEDARPSGPLAGPLPLRLSHEGLLYPISAPLPTRR